MQELGEYSAAAFGVSFAIASQYHEILHDGMTLFIMFLTIIWLCVQIWSKIKITQKETKKQEE